MSSSPHRFPELRLRPLTVADLPGVMEIENVSYSTPWRTDTFQGLFRRGDTDIIGALEDDRLLGYAVCWTIEDQAELGNLAVLPEERGRGIGALLVDASLDRVRERGANVCFLEVRVSNAPARLLYERAGFFAIGRRRDYYAKPREDAIVMRCDLG